MVVEGEEMDTMATGSISPAPISYSSVTSKVVHPPDPVTSALDKTKGVLIRRINGVTISELLEALGKVISPLKILYADYVTAVNFGVWLDTDESVGDLVGLDTLEVKGQMTKMYRYTNPVHRVTLRNVPPFIPDPVINTHLQQYGEMRGVMVHQSVSKVSEQFAHVKSFTRIVNVAMADGKIIPPSIPIVWDGRKHIINVTVGANKCFTCHKSGHNFRNCPSKAESSAAIQTRAPKRKSIPNEENIESRVQNDFMKRGRFSFSSQVDGSTMETQSDSELIPSASINLDNTFATVSRKGPGRSRNTKPVSGTIVANTVPWAFDTWKNGSFKKYKTLSKEGLYIFLQTLKRNFMDGGYTRFNNSVAMATSDPQELYDLLFEVINSLGKTHDLAKTEMNGILKLIDNYINLSSEESSKIMAETDLNFRKFELEAYQRTHKLNEKESDKIRKYFFN